MKFQVNKILFFNVQGVIESEVTVTWAVYSSLTK